MFGGEFQVFARPWMGIVGAALEGVVVLRALIECLLAATTTT